MWARTGWRGIIFVADVVGCSLRVVPFFFSPFFFANIFHARRRLTIPGSNCKVDSYVIFAQYEVLL